MNMFPLRWLLPVQGEAMMVMRRMKSERIFPFAHVDGVCVGRNVRYIILGVGQMHPVQQGRFGRLQARKIAAVQMWIFHTCSKLRKFELVRTFGQEGFSSAGGPVRARVAEPMLQDVRAEIKRGGPKRFLYAAASRWRSALRHRRAEAIIRESAKLNGLVALQAMDSGVSIFPIEDRAIHGAVGRNMRELHEMMERLQTTEALRSARSKNGENLTLAEYEAALRFGKLVKTYNKVLASPQRDRAIFQAIMDQAEHERRIAPPDHRPLVILATFVLGQAHRQGFLRLAKRHIPHDTLFLWVTPAPLLFGIRVRQGFVAAAIILAGVGWYLFS